MKGNELDDLFRQKLGNHKLTPPAGSWDKIEDNLAKTTHKGGAFWFRIAAGLLLIFTLGWLIIPTQDDVTPATTAAMEKEIQPTVEADQPDVKPIESNQNQVATKTTPAPKEQIEIQEPAVPAITKSPKLQASNFEDTKVQEPVSEPIDVALSERPVFHIEKIDLSEIAAQPRLMTTFQQAEVLPLDLGLIHTYAEEDGEEIKSRKKFRVLNGLISIAKGVNKSKIGFEGIRNAKNGFINDGLKYGVQETEETEKKEGDDGKNAGDINRNAGDLK